MDVERLRRSAVSRWLEYAADTGYSGGSLRDAQILAGHRSIEMTQRYIDGDTRSQRRLVGLI